MIFNRNTFFIVFNFKDSRNLQALFRKKSGKEFSMRKIITMKQFSKKEETKKMTMSFVLTGRRWYYVVVLYV